MINRLVSALYHGMIIVPRSLIISEDDETWRAGYGATGMVGLVCDQVEYSTVLPQRESSPGR